MVARNCASNRVCAGHRWPPRPGERSV